MKPLFFLIFLCVFSNNAFAAKVVCYYASWATYRPDDTAVTPEDLDPFLCTHINYAFVSVAADGSLFPADEWNDVTEGGYKKVTSLKEQKPDLKVLLSIGGGDSSPETFSEIAADPGKRANMVASGRSFMETYNFDGIDLDWEIPEDKDRDNFATLLEEFRNDFDRNGWEVTAAVRADVSGGYDVPRLSEILSFINVMTYDMYGPWSEYTGQNSPLYASSIESDWQKANLNLDAAVRQWVDAGADPNKVIAGLAFYGHTFTLADPNNNGLHAPITGPGKNGGSLTYLEYCETKNSWSYTWDSEQKVPICVDGDQWLGIDDKDSVKYKVDYIINNGLGGAMIWSIDQDDVHGHCGDVWPLLHIVADNLL